MKYIEIIGTKSFKEWIFFYDLHKKYSFNKKWYEELIENIKTYKASIKNSIYINKNIIKFLFISMWNFSGMVDMLRDREININWIKDWEELNNYYDDLYVEIMQLMNTEKED